MSKFFKIILTLIFVFIVIFYFSITYLVQTKGKKVLEERTSLALKRVVKINDLRYSFPSTIKIEDITIDGIKPASKIDLQLDVSNILRNEIQVAHLILINPSFSLRRTNEGKIVFTGFNQQKDDKSFVQSEPKEAFSINPESSQLSRIGQLSLKINQFIVKNGEVDLLDEAVAKAENLFKVEKVFLKKIDLLVKDISFPLESLRTEYLLTGSLSLPGTPIISSRVESEGWLNLQKKDMEGKVQVFNTDDTSILNAKIVSYDNQMKVEGLLTAKNLFQNQNDQGEAQNLILNTMSSMGLELAMSFSFNTQMDDFRIDRISFSGNMATANNSSKIIP